MKTQSDKGAVLTVVIIVIIILTLLAGYTLNFAYNQRRLTNRLSGTQLKAYYRAQAGVVNAQWRIRTNFVTDIGGVVGGNDFLNPAWNPDSYSINLTTNVVSHPPLATDDVLVDIGEVDTSATPAKGFRRIESTGRDT